MLLGGVTLMAVGALVFLVIMRFLSPFWFGPSAIIDVGYTTIYFFEILTIFLLLSFGLMISGLLITIGAARME